MSTDQTDSRINFGLVAGVLCAATEALYGVLSLPILATNLGKATVGNWILMTTVGSGILLIQAGFSQKLTRMAAQTIDSQENGSLPIIPTTLVAQLNAGYLVAAAGMGVASYFAFVYYLREKQLVTQASHDAVAWSLYVLGLATQVGAQLNFSLLNGIGELGWDKVARIGSLAAQLTLLNWALPISPQLSTAMLIYCGAALASLLASILLLSARSRHYEPLARPNWRMGLAFFRQSTDLMMMNVSGFVVGATIPIMLSSTAGLEKLAEFGCASRVGAAMATVGIIASQMYFPGLVRSYTAGDYVCARRQYMNSQCFALLICSTGLAFVLLLPAHVLGILTGGIAVPGITWMSVLLFQTLYTVHVTHVNCYVAISGEGFPKLAVLNAVLAAPLVYAAVKLLGPNWAAVGLILAALPASIPIIRMTRDRLLRMGVATI